ncbi:hypothetical protein ACOSQ2_007109 [Xanthoceras sorbifolium]
MDSSSTEVPKIRKMGWINYFKQESRSTDSTGKTKTRKEVSEMWKALSLEEKSRYRNIEQQKTGQCVLGNGSGLAEDEDILNDLDIPHVNQTFTTRYTPSRLFWVVSKLSNDQKRAVIGFGHLFILTCGSLY